MEEPIQKKRIRNDSDELYVDSPEVKRLKEDLLDDSDPSTTTPEDLDSFMKSFQEEISASPSPPPPPTQPPSNLAESQTDLGYLLEASDDELGLPPSTSLTPVREVVASSEEQEKEPERIEFGELWKLDDEFLSYDSFEFGIGIGCGQEESGGYNFNGGEYVALDGLFDYSDFGVEPSETAELLVRPETLPAQ